jgi:hypothetical protein
LEYVTYGKPMKTTYEYAESLLDKIDPLPKGPDGQPAKRIVYGNLSLALLFLLRSVFCTFYSVAK